MSSHNRSKTTAAHRVYGDALLALAQAHQQTDAIADEVDQLAGLLVENPGLVRLLATRTLSKEELGGAIDRLFQGKVSDTIHRFLRVVNAKGRLADLPGILAAFGERLEERRGIVEADLFVAARLNEDEVKQVADRLGAAIGKRVVVHQYVDESLIGGIKIRLGDQLIDGSVAAQLKQLRKQLIEEGREKARRTAAG